MNSSALAAAAASPPVAPPPTKRLKGSDTGAFGGGGFEGPMPDEGPQSIIAQFVSPQGESLGPPLEVPLKLRTNMFQEHDDNVFSLESGLPFDNGGD